MILGITGGSGCGTTTVGHLLEQYGFYFVDADSVYHELLTGDSALKERLVFRFGSDIVRNGEIDRRALATIVFSDPQALKDLNELTHAVIIQAVSDRVHASGKPNAAIEAIALIESGMAQLCDAVVGVLCGREERLHRIMQRDSRTEAEAAARIDAQQDDAFFIDHCDYILLNDRTPEELREAVHALVQAIGCEPASNPQTENKHTEQ